MRCWEWLQIYTNDSLNPSLNPLAHADPAGVHSVHPAFAIPFQHMCLEFKGNRTGGGLISYLLKTRRGEETGECLIEGAGQESSRLDLASGEH